MLKEMNMQWQNCQAQTSAGETIDKNRWGISLISFHKRTLTRQLLRMEMDMVTIGKNVHGILLIWFLSSQCRVKRRFFSISVKSGFQPCSQCFIFGQYVVRPLDKIFSFILRKGIFLIRSSQNVYTRRTSRLQRCGFGITSAAVKFIDYIGTPRQ